MSHDFSSVRVIDEWQRPSHELIRAFSSFPVANIGDAMERLYMCDAGIVPLSPGLRCVGSALPVLVPAGDNAAVIKALDFIQSGDIMMINGQGHIDRGLVGEQLTQRFLLAGATGAVIDGAIRDRAVIESLHFPTYARGTSPAGPYKNGPGVIGEAVAIGRVVVQPGDIVACDDDGVIVIPQERAEEILEKVKAVARREAEMTAEISR